ncbi:hypothetical protein LOTGIDRAFT_174458 [Lottia gigantea]|uniref:Ig-like domain-containing protein n=1 Tax=Lottia gigantea TaxID=225164 RepID=V4AWW5_LOTGI|nr:hypothetical protein LOTGIDRAFT_174458 [Lottia gigantea]ESO98021.1 hypothetical protein LOTGIDRAFT_174458 [Lottia gigantea]
MATAGFHRCSWEQVVSDAEENRIARATRTRVLYKNKLTPSQDLLSIKPEVFIEGEPGDVTCTYNNQYTTFEIYGSIGDTQTITTCRVQLSSCIISSTGINYTQYYNISKTNNSVTIHIYNVNKTRDSGVWRCKVFVSAYNQSEETLTIDVKVPVSSVEITNNNVYYNYNYSSCSVEITNKNEDFIKDRTVNLECKTTGGYPLPNITWSINTRILMTSVNTTTSSLSYQPVVSDQGQRLQCSATNGYGQSKTDSFQLDIKYQPVVDINSSITLYKLIQGQTVKLECQVNQSNPVVTSYKWYRNGNIITGSSSTYTVSNDGSYSCSATNSVGESDRSRVISVEILYPPSVSTPQSPYSIIESTPLTIPCIVTSNPVPNNYTWSGPNNLIQSQQNLTISSINRDQTGQYTCTVSNIMIPTTGVQQTGTGINSTTVNVLYGPEVSVSSVETNIKENENLRINCKVKSNPPTNDIVWYQSNGDIVPNQFVINSGANRRDLVINNINRSKSDNYTCTARLDLHPTVGEILPQTHSQSSTINVQCE